MPDSPARLSSMSLSRDVVRDRRRSARRCCRGRTAARCRMNSSCGVVSGVIVAQRQQPDRPPTSRPDRPPRDGDTPRPRFMVGRQVMTPTVNTPISRPSAAASAFTDGDALRGLGHRRARRLHEEGVAVLHRKGAADRRGAGVHDHRLGAAVGLGLGAHLLELDELAVEIEIVARRTSIRLMASIHSWAYS